MFPLENSVYTKNFIKSHCSIVDFLYFIYLVWNCHSQRYYGLLLWKTTAATFPSSDNLDQINFLSIPKIVIQYWISIKKNSFCIPFFINIFGPGTATSNIYLVVDRRGACKCVWFEKINECDSRVSGLCRTKLRSVKFEDLIPFLFFFSHRQVTQRCTKSHVHELSNGMLNILESDFRQSL